MSNAQPIDISYTQGNILNKKTGELQSIAALLYMCTGDEARFLNKKDATVPHDKCNKDLWRACYINSVSKEMHLDCVLFTFKDNSVISLKHY